MQNTNQSSKINLQTCKKNKEERKSNDISINMREKRYTTYNETFDSSPDNEMSLDLKAGIMESKTREMINGNTHTNNKNTNTKSKIKKKVAAKRKVQKVVQAENIKKEKTTDYDNATTSKLQSDFDGNKCKWCESTFQNTLDLIRHEQKHHRGKENRVKEIICNMCDVTLNTKTAYYDHMKHVHELIRKDISMDFPCEVCGHTFTEEQFLISHMQLHTSEHLTNKNKNYVETEVMQEEEEKEEASNNDNIANIKSQNDFDGNKCETCGSKFQTKRDLISHKKEHERVKMDSKNKIVCNICKVSLITKQDYYDHLKSVHEIFLEEPPKNDFPCEICGHQFTEERFLKYHMRLHTTEYLTNKNKDDVETEILQLNSLTTEYLTNKSKDNLEMEVMLQEEEEEEALINDDSVNIKSQNESDGHKCDSCGRKFKKKCNLIQHKRNRHGINITTKFVCNINCNVSFTTRRDYYDHLKHVHEIILNDFSSKVSCKDSEKQLLIEKDFVTPHMKSHRPELPYLCDMCGKAFRRSTALVIHKKRHDKIYEYECDLCDYKAITKSYLTMHMLVHSEEKMHCCDICGKTFSLASNMRRHRKLHVEENRYSCNLCPKKFKLSAYLRNHMKVFHKLLDESSAMESERNFLCNICGRRFAEQHFLKSHMRSHTNIKRPNTRINTMNTRRFICNTCGKEFPSYWTMQSHKRIHTHTSWKHVCNVCGHKSCSNSDLKRHMDIHSDEKKHCCKVCGKAFAHIASMYSHRRIHDVKGPPYSCSICQKNYKLKKLLVTHMKTHKKLDEQNNTEATEKAVNENIVS